MSKLKLVEATLQNNNSDQVIEEIVSVKKPDFTIYDVTVIPDEEYKPTIQSILISLEESQTLKEADTLKLGFNILSETVNEKTRYSHSLFEFESKSRTITLNLSLTESDKYNGVFKVSAHTTKGELIFESNTQFPEKVIHDYLDSLTDKYLLECDCPKCTNIDEEINRQAAIIKSVEDRNPNDGDLSFLYYQLDQLKKERDKHEKKESDGMPASTTLSTPVYPDKQLPIKEDEQAEESASDDVTPPEKETDVTPVQSTYFIRRPQDISDLTDKIDRKLVTRATYTVVDEVTLSPEEYDNYVSNLRQDTKFLSSFRQSPTNTDFTCIAVKSTDRPTLLIDNSGYDSAQYIGME